MNLFTPTRIGICLSLSAALLLAAAGQSAPDAKSLPAEEPVEPSIDLTKLSDDPLLKPKDDANRTTSSNNLKQIGLAVHSYADSSGSLPANIVNRDGKPLLSWRVAILRFLDEGALLKEFKLDEPWDSANNLKLIEKMPKVFDSPRVTAKRRGYTVYQGFSGPDALFRPGKSLRIFDIGDGTSNTILAIEASTAVPWTKPADIPFDVRKPLPELGKPYSGQPAAALCDGSVRILDLQKLKRETLKAAITPAGADSLGSEWK